METAVSIKQRALPKKLSSHLNLCDSFQMAIFHFEPLSRVDTYEDNPYSVNCFESTFFSDVDLPSHQRVCSKWIVQLAAG